MSTNTNTGLLKICVVLGANAALNQLLHSANPWTLSDGCLPLLLLPLLLLVLILLLLLLLLLHIIPTIFLVINDFHIIAEGYLHSVCMALTQNILMLQKSSWCQS